MKAGRLTQSNMRARSAGSCGYGLVAGLHLGGAVLLTGTILNDDHPAVPTASLSVDRSGQFEGQPGDTTSYVFTARLNGAASTQQSLHWAVSGGDKRQRLVRTADPRPRSCLAEDRLGLCAAIPNADVPTRSCCSSRFCTKVSAWVRLALTAAST